MPLPDQRLPRRVEPLPLPGLDKWPESQNDEAIIRVVLDGVLLDGFRAFMAAEKLESSTPGYRVALKKLVVDSLKDKGYLADTYEWYRG